MTNIVILGAGYAGMATAIGLAGRTRRRNDVHITLVNASERFTERLRLHQLASGQELVDLRIPELLAGTGVELVCGWVTNIDTAVREVRVDDERVLPYDTLVYALGGTADTSVVPGAEEHAFTLDSADAAAALARRLARLQTGTVAVCGNGLTGVEAAAEFAERFPHLRVVLIGRQEPGANMASGARAYLASALERLGVQVPSGAEIVKVLPGAVELAGGESVAADAVVWTGGVRVSPLAAAAGLEVDAHGRIVTDAALRSVSHPTVYAVGDAAAVRQGYGTMHGTCQGGMPTGTYVAAAIARDLAGGHPKPFRFGYFHMPVSLGRGDAVIQFTHPDDSPKRLRLTGRRAVWYKSSADRSQVADPKAYLVRIVTNLAMDRLRSARARRETYVGPWLPELILTSSNPTTDADSISMALLMVLENLSPLERAVFVLKEAFGFNYIEIADAVQRTPDAVRQAAHRARGHVQARRPRFHPTRAQHREVTERFFAAAAGGDLNTLMQLLAPDVTLWTDGGGKVRQAMRPVTGAEKVANWFAGVSQRPYEGVNPG